MRHIERTLPVALALDEVAERGRQAARQREAITNRKADKKIADAAWREETEDQEGELDRLLECVKTGSEPRSVRCVERLSESGATIELIRTDTGEIVESRVATDADRQIDMFDGERVRFGAAGSVEPVV